MQDGAGAQTGATRPTGPFPDRPPRSPTGLARGLSPPDRETTGTVRARTAPVSHQGPAMKTGDRPLGVVVLATLPGPI